ncbi:CCC motif membrane protein [Leptobacterium sp. I13]|uniref:CCC motif membrane protein n=1 Tax=Leptobacterium meishanense TaxID=3128904 RepID=UPI0030EEBE05
MEKQKLPNSTLILVFGIVSIVTCCCYGVIGLIFGIIALVLGNKALKLYKENPEAYEGFNNVKTGRILAIIGIVLNVIYLGYVIFMFSTIGYSGIMEQYQNAFDQFN